jgi:hypothetical protein
MEVLALPSTGVRVAVIALIVVLAVLLAVGVADYIGFLTSR